MRLSVAEEVMLQENRILKDELNHFRYYLNGSRALPIKLHDVKVGQTIYCDRDDLQGIATGLLLPSISCIDVGPGIRPQRLLDCPVHILVEPWKPYLEKLVVLYPEKFAINGLGTSFLQNALDKSVDTIFLLDVIEHMDKDSGVELINNAKRVARTQVVIFTPLGFMPQHYSEVSESWEGIEHGELQNHLSGWVPADFSDAVTVVCEDYHKADGQIFGAFYSIIYLTELCKSRLIIISEDLPENFSIRLNDVVVVDPAFAELSHLINNVPKRNMLVVPLKTIAEQANISVEILRSSILNFSLLEDYLHEFELIETYGYSADFLLNRYRSNWE